MSRRPVSFRDVSDDPTPPRPPRSTGPVQYKGEPLEAQRGPGLGCFRFQLVVLAALVVLTPLSVVWDWPAAISTGLLFAVILLLLITGQTIIFLLRLVAADRRGRRRPLGSATPTVGQLEDAASNPRGGAPGAEAPGPTGPAAPELTTPAAPELKTPEPTGPPTPDPTGPGATAATDRTAAVDERAPG